MSGVLFVAWFAGAFGRKLGLPALVLFMGASAILVVFLSSSLCLSLPLYSLISMGTTSILWQVLIAREAPATGWGLKGSIVFLIAGDSSVRDHRPLSIGIRGWRWKDAGKSRGNKRLAVIAAPKKLGKRDATHIVVATVEYVAWTIFFEMATTFGGFHFENVLDRTDSRLEFILTVAALPLPVSATIAGMLLDKAGGRLVLIVGPVRATAGFAPWE